MSEVRPEMQTAAASISRSSLSNDRVMLDNLHYIKDIGLRSRKALELGNVSDFAHLLHEHGSKKSNVQLV